MSYEKGLTERRCQPHALHHQEVQERILLFDVLGDLILLLHLLLGDF